MTTQQLQQTIQDVITPIVQTYKPDKIILFGSAAIGRMHEDSDFDLVIIKKTDKRFYDRIGEVLRIVRDISPKPPIDFLVYTPEEFNDMKEANYFVRDEIIEKGKVLYG